MQQSSRPAPGLVPPVPELSLFAGGLGPTRAYDVAGCVVHTDVDAPWLRPLLLPASVPGTSPGSGPAEAEAPRTFGEPVYDGPGLVGGVVRRVIQRRSEKGCLLEVEGVRSAAVDFDSGVARRLGGADAPPTSLEIEILFGPALVLLLATRGVFCLHASAARVRRQAVVFLGPSGAGKSTLARAAPRSGGWERIGDDILPVALTAEGADALPRFPQLKLPEGAQWGRRRPGRVPIRSAYEVRTGPPAPGGAILVTPTSSREALLRLVRFTVASRLFDRTLTERHLAFCDGLARRARVSVLTYPRSFEVLPAVYDALERDYDPPHPSSASRPAERFES